MAETIQVLCVDDDPQYTDLTQTYLQRQSETFTVDVVNSGSAVLEYLEQQDVECIVSDYEMPQMDGLELLDHVRSIEPDLPFILYTGKGSEEIASQAISQGVTDYIQKRAHTEQYELLANRIRNAVDRHRAKSQVDAERKRFDQLFEQLSQPVVELELPPAETHPHVTRVNSAFETMFDQADASVSATPVDQLDIPLPSALGSSDSTLPAADDFATQTCSYDTGGETRELLLQTATYPDEPRAFIIYTDITDQRRRERQLQRQTNLLARIQSIADVGGWQWDVAHDAGHYTDHLYEIYGAEHSDEITPRRDIAQYYHPDDVEMVLNAFDAAINAGDAYDLEARLDTPGNETTWVRTQGEPRVENGECIELLGAVQDITARKQREQRLERYERFLDQSPDFMLAINEDLTVEYENPPSPKFDWGVDDTDTEPLDVVHPADQSVILTFINDLSTDDDHTGKIEFRARGTEGEWRWIESHARYIEQEPDSIVLAAMRDITQRKRQQQRETRYRRTLEELQTVTSQLLETESVDRAAEIVVAGIESAFDFDIVGCWLTNPTGNELIPAAISDSGAELLDSYPTYTADSESLSWSVFQQNATTYFDDLSYYDTRANADSPIQSEIIAALGDHGVINVGATTTDAFTPQEVKLLNLWSETVTAAFARIR